MPIERICFALLKNISILLALVIIMPSVRAEGTKQIMPSPTSHGRVIVYPEFNDFAIVGGNADCRLNIRVNNTSETIYLGFGLVFDGSENLINDVCFQVVAPNGTVVYGNTYTPVPTSGAGYIASYSQAIAGPSTMAAGGYNAIAIHPTMTGDYRIEFIYPNMFGLGERREFSFFDITVANAANQAINGRLWSKGWQFSVGISLTTNDPYDHRFEGKLYVYSDDGVVSALDLNNIQPLVFLISCNDFGTYNTGNFSQDRKSIYGKSVIPQYKLFLNDPDSICFPTGALGAFVQEPTFTGCSAAGLTFNVNVNTDGYIKILLNLNGIAGYQSGSTDVELLVNVNAGANNIIWNGVNGLGNPHTFNSPIEVIFTFISGLTNLPMYDIEYNRQGFKVEIVRPWVQNPIPPLFWDDSNLGGTVELGGCTNPSGCHLWDGYYDDLAWMVYSMGNENTINTWWYASRNISDTITIIPPTITIDASNLSICQGDTTELNAHGGQTYSWSSQPVDPQLNQTPGGVNNPMPVSPAQTTTYTVTGTDNRGCSNTAEMEVSIIPGPTMTTNDPSVCIGDSAVLIAGGAQHYLWDINGSTTGSITIYTEVSNTFTVTGTNAQGCTSTAAVDVTVNPLPTVNVSPDTLCSGDYLSLQASGAIYYTWSNGQSGNPILIHPMTSSIYSVTGTDANGCKDTSAALITVLPAPEVYAGYDTTVCAKEIVYLYAWGTALNYSWGYGINGDSITVQPEQTTTYTVTGSDINNCKSTAAVHVTAIALPIAAYHADPPVLPSYDHSVQLSDISGGDPVWWRWTFCDSSTFYTQNVFRQFSEDFFGECELSLYVENYFGCHDSVTGILIIRTFQTIYIPNAFSPNGDGTNDYFHISGINLTGSDFSIQIFNRWGQQVFSSTDVCREWDGTANGEVCPQGVYTYSIFYTDSDLTKHHLTGHITLLPHTAQ